MSYTYLTEVVINNFRCIGNLRVEVPGPGVLILAGPNGLGKSTFFEAIEWVIGGSVQRVEKHKETAKELPHRYLARILGSGSPVDQFKVGLNFVNSDAPNKSYTLSRTANRGADRGFIEVFSDNKHIQDWFVSDGWAVGLDKIPSYLRLTHVLPQPREQQQLWHSEKDRWERMEEPAGLKYLGSIQARLKQTSDPNGPMMRSIEQTRRSLEQARKVLEDWRTLVAERDNAFHHARLAGAMSPSEVIADMAQLTAEAGVSIALSNEAVLENVQQHLMNLRTAVGDRFNALSRQHERFQSIVSSMPRWEEYRRIVSVHESEVVTTLDFIDERTRQAEEIKEILDELARKNQSLAERSDKIQQEQRDLSRLLAASHELPVIEALVHTVEEALRSANQSMEDIELQFQRAEANRQAHITLKAQLEALGFRRTKLTQLAKRLDEWIVCMADRSRLEEELTQLNQSKQVCSSTLHNVTTSIHHLRSTFERERLAIAGKRERIDSRRQAIAHLVALLNDDEQVCPLCLTEFAKFGELMERARVSATREDLDLVEAERALLDVRRQLEEAEGERKQLEQTQVEIDEKIRQGSEQLVQIQAQIRLLQMEVFGNDRSDASVPTPQHRRTQIDQEILINDEQEASLRATLDQLPIESQSDDFVDELRRALTDARKTTQALRTRASDEKLRRDELRAIVQSHPGSSSPQVEEGKLQNQINQFAIEREKTEQQRDEVDAAIRRNNELLAQILSEIAEARSKNALRKQQRDEFLALMVEFQKTWNDAGLEGSPEHHILERELSFVAQQLTVVAHGGRIYTGLERIAVALQRWANNNSFQAKQQRVLAILEQAQCPSESEYESSLDRKVHDCENKLSQQEAIVKDVRTLVSRLKQEATDYADTVLAPIGSRLDACLRALSSNRRWQAKEEVYRTAGKNQMRTAIIWNAGPEELKLDVRSVLSEGQLAAVSLAQLISMSTSWKWCRWPALLLDDPAQYNDIVHVSAFIDMMRNLVQSSSYQIIVSTHDLELADFFRRKLEAMDIPSRTLRFSCMGPDGVEWDLQT